VLCCICSMHLKNLLTNGTQKEECTHARAPNGSATRVSEATDSPSVLFQAVHWDRLEKAGWNSRPTPCNNPGPLSRQQHPQRGMHCPAMVSRRREKEREKKTRTHY
jgi:hypothetical protein